MAAETVDSLAASVVVVVVVAVVGPLADSTLQNDGAIETAAAADGNVPPLPLLLPLLVLVMHTTVNQTDDALF